MIDDPLAENLLGIKIEIQDLGIIAHGLVYNQMILVLTITKLEAVTKGSMLLHGDPLTSRPRVHAIVRGTVKNGIVLPIVAKRRRISYSNYFLTESVPYATLITLIDQSLSNSRLCMRCMNS